MTDEQIRLYAIARTVAPLDARISIIAEPVAGGRGTLYAIVLTTPALGKRALFPGLEIGPDERLERWFVIHSNVLRDPISDRVLASELERVFA